MMCLLPHYKSQHSKTAELSTSDWRTHLHLYIALHLHFRSHKRVISEMV
jgi:hypothetical protein